MGTCPRGAHRTRAAPPPDGRPLPAHVRRARGAAQPRCRRGSSSSRPPARGRCWVPAFSPGGESSDSDSTSFCRAAAPPGTRASGASSGVGSDAEALERVAQPLVGGIYTADPDRLSLAATMPRFLALEREHRSLILGLRRTARAGEAAGASGARWSLFVTLAEGMEELRRRTLAARLPAAAVRLRIAATAVVPAGGWRVELSDGSHLRADGVVLAGPAPGMATLVDRLDPALSALLDGIAVRLVGDGGARLFTGRGPASARRLRVRRPASGAASDARVHVFEREVPGARARRVRPPARLRRRGVPG